MCNRDDLDGAEATHDCLNKNLLATPSGETRVFIGSKFGNISTKLKLPAGLTCQQCVFQVIL